jgi:multidrug transporter EmrE-like cation transporter
VPEITILPNRFLELAAVAGLAALCAGGDYFLKKASELPNPFSSVPFWTGFAIYGISAFGWVYALQWFKLSAIGAIFSVVLILLLALMGITLFSERLNPMEIVGLILAVASILILTRFS